MPVGNKINQSVIVSQTMMAFVYDDDDDKNNKNNVLGFYIKYTKICENAKQGQHLKNNLHENTKT